MRIIISVIYLNENYLLKLILYFIYYFINKLLINYFKYW